MSLLKVVGHLFLASYLLFISSTKCSHAVEFVEVTLEVIFKVMETIINKYSQYCYYGWVITVMANSLTSIMASAMASATPKAEFLNLEVIEVMIEAIIEV